MDIDSLTIDEVIETIRKCDDYNIEISMREKNAAFMYANNITDGDAKVFIRSLDKSDLVKGPVNDYNKERNHPLWIFKKYGFSTMCYIKIKIINKGKKTIVISFHEDEK